GEAISAAMKRASQVPEHDVGVIGINTGDALFIAADISSHVGLNDSSHYMLGGFKAGRQFDLVALGLEDGQVSRLVRAKSVEVPRLEFVEPVFGDRAGSCNQHVVKMSCDPPGSWIPTSVLHLPCLLLPIAVGIPLGLV